MAKNYWLVKQEPSSYSWATFVKEGGTAWTGVRNFAARLHLRAMKNGDLALFYHSGDAKEIVGLGQVSREAYPDPTASEGDWSAVDLTPVKPLVIPVPLASLKSQQVFQDMPMLRQSRLSVSPMTRPQFLEILRLGKTKP